MDASSREKRFRTWLSKPETLKLLSRIAGDIAQTLRNYSGAAAQLPQLVPDEPISEDVVAELVSELCLFLIEKCGQLDRVLFANNPSAYLRQAFLNHLRETARSRNRDNFRYLYKRAADALRKAPDIFTSAAASNVTVFNLQKNGRTIQPLAAEDFSEIPFPVGRIDVLTYEGVNKEAVLLDLARYFWEKLSELYGGVPIQIPVKDFIGWIGLHVPLAGRGDRVADTEVLSDPHTAPDRIYFDAAAVKTWARNFAQRLSPRQQQVFVLRHHKRLGYAAIARQMGYRGPSGPKMAVHNIEAQLRTFLIDLPWLSPDGCRDPNPKALELFWQTLFDNLKKELSTPS